jgi:hypothetical protein
MTSREEVEGCPPWNKSASISLDLSEAQRIIEVLLQVDVDVPLSLERVLVYRREVLANASKPYEVKGIEVLDKDRIDRVVLVAMRQETQEAVHFCATPSPRCRDVVIAAREAAERGCALSAYGRCGRA